jgi:hypothetical protein
VFFVPASWEAEARGSLEPKRSEPANLLQDRKKRIERKREEKKKGEEGRKEGTENFLYSS